MITVEDAPDTLLLLYITEADHFNFNWILAPENHISDTTESVHQHHPNQDTRTSLRSFTSPSVGPVPTLPQLRVSCDLLTLYRT